MGAARAARSKWSAAAASRPGRHVIRRTGDAGAAGAGDANSSVGRAGQGRGGRDGLVTFAGICRPNDTLERDPSPPQATRQVEAQAAAVASAGRRPDGAASDAPTSPSHDHLWATKPIPSPPQAQDVLVSIIRPGRVALVWVGCLPAWFRPRPAQGEGGQAGIRCSPACVVISQGRQRGPLNA